MIHWLQQSVRDNNHQNHQIFVPPCIRNSASIYFSRPLQTQPLRSCIDFKHHSCMNSSSEQSFVVPAESSFSFKSYAGSKRPLGTQNFRATWMSMFLAQVEFCIIRFTWENGLPYGTQRVGVDCLILYKHIILHRIMNKLYFTEETIWNVMRFSRLSLLD